MNLAAKVQKLFDICKLFLAIKNGDNLRMSKKSRNFASVFVQEPKIMVVIGIDFIIAILSGMLIMTCLGWFIYFIRDKSPMAQASAYFALALTIGYSITSFMLFPNNQQTALAWHILAVDMLAMPMGAITMVLVMESTRVTLKRVLWNILPFVLLCPLCVIVQQRWYLYMMMGLIACYVIAMITYIVVRGIRYERRIKDAYSDLSNQSILWVVVVLVFVALVVTNFLVFINEHNTYLRLIYTIVAILAWHLIFARLHLIVRNRETGNSMQIEDLMNEDAEKGEVTLMSEDVVTFQKNLSELCENQEIYCKEDLTRDELARQMGMSHTNFTNLLKKTTGMSFYEYINDLRIKKATQLLDEGRTDITAISQMVGYRYRSSMYRAFAAVHKCTPLEYVNKKNN